MASREGAGTTRRGYDYARDHNLARSDEAHTTLRYDDAARPDRLTGVLPDGGSLFACDHDGNGNLLGLPGQRYEYNAKNELSRLTRSDGLVAEYGYDHLGMRISKTITEGGRTARTLNVGDQCEVRDGAPVYFVAIGAVRVAALGGGTIRLLHDDDAARIALRAM